ncbi:MAG: transglutaminase domain-containing protein [Clostridia bacterium]
MGNDELGTTKNIYHFVRDQIKHSWDIQDQRVTIRASDVLREKVGICYAKSNLLAALLRANHIPRRNLLSASHPWRYARDWILHTRFECRISCFYWKVDPA